MASRRPKPPASRRNRPADRPTDRPATSRDEPLQVLAHLPADDAASNAGRMPRAAVVLMAIGLALRLGISAVSWGSSDAATFARFGQLINDLGLFNAYKADFELNHPPLMALWAWGAWRLAGSSMTWFPFVFKLPIIAFEAVTAWTLWRVWHGRDSSAGGTAKAVAAVAGYALSACAILVSGFHCNTDTVFAGLMLLSVWLLSTRRPLWGGLALAAAINVKIIPVLIIPGLLLGVRSRRDAARFLAGLSVGVLPFLPVLISVGPTFYQNAIAYKSNLDKWGILTFLLPSADRPEWDEMLPAFAYHDNAKWPLLAVIVIWAAVARWLRRWDAYEVSAVTLGLFLVFAPGFGVQYTALVVPLMLAVRPRTATVYSAAAGLFLAAVYYVTLDDAWPLQSRYYSLFPQPTPWLGLAAWGTLVYFVVATIGWPRNPIGPLPDARPGGFPVARARGLGGT